MTDLKSFKKDWKNLTDLEQRVRILDRIKENPSAFPAYHSDFLGFVKDIYKVHDPQLNLLNIGHPGMKTNQAEHFHYFTQKHAVKKSQKDISDISKDFGEDLEEIALSVIPVRDTDLRDVDKLDVDKLIVDYRAKAVEKRKELLTINKKDDPEGHEAIEDLANEYNSFADIINDHKHLIKEIAKYQDLRSNLFSNEGKPDVQKLKSLIDEYLDKLEKGNNLNDHDKIAIKTTRLLSDNPRNLTSYYDKIISDPAKETVKDVIKNKNYDIKKYLDRTVEKMNVNSAASFFSGVYAKKAT